MIGRTLGVAYTGETANALLCLVLPRPVLPPCLDDLLDLTRMLTRAAFPPAPEAPPSPDVSAAFDAVSRAPDPRAVWQRLLEQFNGNKRAIARFFNIDHKTVYTRLEQCGLHKRREEP
jgi:DNA-binding NtrC family response regulator